MIRLGLHVGYPSDEDLVFVRQLGLRDVVTSGPVPPGQPEPPCWDFQSLLLLRKRVEDAGLRLPIIDAKPPGLFPHLILGLPGREVHVERFCETLRNMGAAGIHRLTFDFTWMQMRTSLTHRLRGGAQATAFNIDDVREAPLTEHGVITEDKMWDNWTYFIRNVIAVAEEADVKLALHPDDPPVSSVRGIGRPFRSLEAFKRVIETVDSDNNGISFCQGCFSEMGEDVVEAIRYFGARRKIIFVHFRDITGTATKFYETFHDGGPTDMLAAMKAYKEVGYDGPMRPDHYPKMIGDSPWGHRTRAFAVGYIKGLIEAVYGKQQTDDVQTWQ